MIRSGFELSELGKDASTFFALPLEREMMSWDEFRVAIDNAGRKGWRFFLHEASLCFIDIVGMAGGCIAGYEREWFDAFALPLLQKFSLQV